jgi:SusE outer membrane protein
MKKIIFNIALIFSIAAIFTACKKDETKLVFEESTASKPSLKLSATNVTLDANKLSDDIITMEATKANYGSIATEVKYSISITLPGAKPKDTKVKVFSLTPDKLSKTLNVEVLNDIFIYDFEVEGGKTYKVNVEAVANEGTAYELRSPITVLTVTTYL